MSNNYTKITKNFNYFTVANLIVNQGKGPGR